MGVAILLAIEVKAIGLSKIDIRVIDIFFLLLIRPLG